MVKPIVIDFSDEPRTVSAYGSKKKELQVAPSVNKKVVRARIRRTGKITKEEFEILYKPIEDWDAEELARGRPRSKDGTFSGKPPAWISREMHEEIVNRFTEVVKLGMQEQTVKALSVIASLLESDEVSIKGTPLVPAATKADLAKFLLEHVVGKPKQRQEVDISVKLQGLLATAVTGVGFGGPMAAISQQGAASVAAYTDAFGADAVEAESWEDEDSDLDERGD